MRKKLNKNKEKIRKKIREKTVRAEKKNRQETTDDYSFLKNSRLLTPSSTEAISVTKIPL